MKSIPKSKKKHNTNILKTLVVKQIINNTPDVLYLT